jgi:phage baseplate assembly protein W
MVSRYDRILFSKGSTSYKDIDLSFLSTPNTGDLRTKIDLDSIKQSMKILLFTNFGERPFRPNLSGDLNSLLFEPFDIITKSEYQRIIKSTLRAYEPRVAVEEVIVDQAADKVSVNIIIKFRVTSSPNIETLQVMLKRIR